MRFFTVLLLLCCCAAIAARPAHAADYRVVQCANAPHDFIPFSESPGMYVQDQCGSIAGISVKAYPNAAITTEHDVMWLAWAPDGTTFSRWQAAFQGGANGHSGFAHYALVCADVHCLQPLQYLYLGGSDNWGSPTFREWRGVGALRLQFGLVCSFGASICFAGSNPPGADMFAPEMWLTDHYPPAAPSLTGGSLPSRGWQSGRTSHSISFATADRGGGVDRVVVSDSSGASWVHVSNCARGNGAYSRLVPCPLSANVTLPIDIAGLADGRHEMWSTAVDAAGQTGASGPYVVLVDNNAPAAPKAVTVLGGEGWRARDGFSLRWARPREQFAPVAAAHWQVCLATGACRSGRVAAANPVGLDDFAVGRSGDYTVRVWFEDAAGNQAAANASVPVHLRFDGEPPRAAFEPRDPARPLRVAVAVDDNLSGLAGGTIEVHREGTDTWHLLPTTVEGRRLVASLDDETLPDGRYEMRARAVDGAGNEVTTERDQDGAHMTVQVPIRVVTRMRVGARVSRVRRATVRRRGRRVRVRRRVKRVVRRTVVARGAKTRIEGVLTSADGRPLANVDVAVLAAAAGTSSFEPVATLRTDAAGRFAYDRRPARSQTLRVRFPGSSHMRGAAADVYVGVRAASSIRTDDASVLNGEWITLSGRVRTRPVPANGKLVEVQAFFRDRWRTFSTVRTDSVGRWRLPYQFGGTIGTVRYRFRVRLPAEGGYGFETGFSRPRSVTVRGP